MTKRLRSRALALLLSMAMLLTLLPVSVFAENTSATWEPIALEDIQPEDTIAVTMTSSGGVTYGLPAARASAAPSASVVTVSEDGLTLTTSSAEDFGWTITQEEDGYTLSVGEDKLYTTAANNGVRVGSYSSIYPIYVWHVDEVSGYLAAQDTKGDTRYLGVYETKPDWRAYTNTTGNTKGQTPGLWKLTGDDPGPIDPDPVEITPIAEAKVGDPDAEYTVEGMVTFLEGQNIYLQDETGGICARCSTVPEGIALGDTIQATGKPTAYNGLPQLGSATYAETDTQLSLSPKATTLGALTDDDLCTLVALSGLEITAIADGGGSWTNPNITMTDGTDSIQIYRAVMEKVDDAWAFQVGDVVDVKAVFATFSGYQLRNSLASDITLAAAPADDPIPDDSIPEGTLDIAEALAGGATTEDVTVMGQVVYHYGSVYNGAESLNSIILEDVIDGEIVGFQVYDYNNYASYVVGDVVAITGKIADYNGVLQMSFPTMTVVEAGKDPIPAQTVTLSQLGADYLSEYIYIQDVTLGTYNAGGNTPVTDATGSASIHKAAPLPSGTVTDLYAACSVFKGTYQLRNGRTSDYVTEGGPVVPGDQPQDGDVLMLYNKSSQGVLSGQDDNEASPSITNGTATLAEGEATAANGGRVFTVEVNAKGEYLFKTEHDGYLTSGPTGNSTFYSPEATEYSTWKLEEHNGGYKIMNVAARFNGQYTQYLEYYGGTYKTYSYYNVTDEDIYINWFQSQGQFSDS